MAISTMYPAKAGSPKTQLTAELSASGTSMSVADASVLPAAPNLCVIGYDENAEVVLYNAINGNVVSGLVRAQGGTTASVWPVNTDVARNYTSFDHDRFIENIEDLETNKISGVAWGDVTGTLSDQTDLANALNGKQNVLNIDSTPTVGSTNPVESGGVKTALDTLDDSKVSKSGDTMTGDLSFKTTVSPSSSAVSNWAMPIVIKDSNETEIGRLQIAQDDNVYSDTRRLGLFTYRTVNGVDVTNGIQIGVDASGNKRYKVSDPEQFCADVGAAEKTIVDNIDLSKVQLIGSGSINDLLDGGVYYLRNNAVSGLPDGTNGYAITFCESGKTYRKQIFMRQGTPGSNDSNIYVRGNNTNSTTSWGSWNKYPAYTDSGWQTWTNSSVFTGTVYYRKIGVFGIITFTGIKVNSEVTGGNIDLGSMSASLGMSPKYLSTFPARINMAGATNYSCNFTIYNTGSNATMLRLYKDPSITSITTTAQIHTTAVYLLD